ncbi:DnaJ domain-containing protein [uncultured Clostridium sp.]|uniref:J domain-containing protein n=1 Tax=uncultured Clostridium sp. TaxID=59620 RepID=UPI00260B2208|nr:DnaJ domain-containing protein [uncultured Clostridium sp.]
MNPYEVLGLREGASQEEIKAAYKTLVKKYHPDQFTDNPLKELANEKLKEINEAYDTLMKASTNNNSYTGNNNSNINEFQEIRMLIQNRNYQLALNKLNAIQNHNAEWNYLMGISYFYLGKGDSALNYLQQAVNLDPNNFEYRQTLNNLMQRNRNYGNQYYNTNRSNGMDICNCCVDLWCLNSLCNCFCGNGC